MTRTDNGRARERRREQRGQGAWSEAKAAEVRREDGADAGPAGSSFAAAGAEVVDDGVEKQAPAGSEGGAAAEGQTQSQPGSEGAWVDAPMAAKLERKRRERPLLIAGVVALVICVGSFAWYMAAEGASGIDSATVEETLATGVSTSLDVGVVLGTSDDDYSTESQDYEIVNDSGAETTTIQVWDYAGVDGDYVQVLVDGEAVTDAFMITHDPVEIEVPATGSIQIKGIHDGGGGLTYAAYCELSGEIYFNNAPEGELNTYTFITQ